MASAPPVTLSWRPTIIALALVAAGTAVGLVWADAPRHRKLVLFEAPIALVKDATVSGTFLPEHEGPIKFSIRFPRDGRFDELVALIGGGWGYSDARPMGLSVSYSKRNSESIFSPMVPILEYAGGAFGANTVDVGLAWFENGQIPTGFELRVDAAAAGLAKFDATFIVEAGGDWANYAWLEAAMRLFVVTAGAIVALIAIGIVRLVSARRFAYRVATSG